MKFSIKSILDAILLNYVNLKNRIISTTKKISIDKVKHYFFNKNTIVLLSIIAILIFGSNVWTQYASKIIVDPVFSLINPSTWKNIVWIVLLICIFATFIRNFARGYLPNPVFTNYSITFSLFYIHLRFINENIWSFTSLETISSLKYTDVFFLTGFMSIIYKCVEINLYFRKNLQPVSEFFIDAPLKRQGIDLLGYKPYAESIAEKVNKSVFENAFAIGVTSNWGGGKTSFFNMIEERLDTSIVKIHFSAWRSNTPQSIIRDFFQTVKESFSKYSTELSQLLNNYSEKIIELDDNAVAKSVKLLFSSTKEKSLERLFKQINETIERSGKRLVIFIDDVDRLDSQEVFEVIRLIRNTANFYNTCFIVAYDRTYILNALKSMDIHHHETFLEKIFQLEITLPYFEKRILIDHFISNMKKTFPNRNEFEIENTVLKKEGDKVFFLEWIHTIRDVTRLSNSILLNIKNIETEVDLIDFIRIEILRFKYPSVYEILFKMNDLIFEVKYSNYSRKERLALRKSAIQENETVLEKYLTDKKDKLAIETEEIGKILDFVSDIFSDEIRITFGNTYVAPSHLAITNNDRFPLYFAYGLVPSLLSEREFLNVITSDIITLTNQIDKWILDYKEEKLKTRFKDLNVDELSSRANFENVINGIFYLTNTESAFSKNSILIEYEFKDLFEKLNPHSKFIKRFYSDLKQYNAFINKVFDDDQTAIKFKAKFLKYISVYADPEKFLPISSILDAKEIEYYLVKYFKQYCYKIQELDNDIWLFWDCCKIPSLVRMLHPEEEIHRDVVFPKVRATFIDFISTKDLNNFLLYNIHIDYRNDSENKFQIGTIGNEVFGSLCKFKEFLFTQDEKKWTNLSEYKRFFDLALKANGKLISFDFQTIDLAMRIGKFNENNS